MIQGRFLSLLTVVPVTTLMFSRLELAVVPISVEVRCWKRGKIAFDLLNTFLPLSLHHSFQIEHLEQ